MVVSSCTAEIILERERGNGGVARPLGGEGNGGKRVVQVGGAGDWRRNWMGNMMMM